MVVFFRAIFKFIGFIYSLKDREKKEYICAENQFQLILLVQKAKIQECFLTQVMHILYGQH